MMDSGSWTSPRSAPPVSERDSFMLPGGYALFGFTQGDMVMAFTLPD